MLEFGTANIAIAYFKYAVAQKLHALFELESVCFEYGNILFDDGQPPAHGIKFLIDPSKPLGRT